MLPKLFPATALVGVDCFTILLGSNDCALQGCLTNQHVPIDEYKQNLADIVVHLEKNGLERRKIILLTPPPYYHENFVKFWVESGKPGVPKRSNEQPKIYAKACLELGASIGVDVCDVHSVFEEDGQREALFCDGIHFSQLGADLLFQTVLPLVEKRLLQELKVESLTANLPYWMDVGQNEALLD